MAKRLAGLFFALLAILPASSNAEKAAALSSTAAANLDVEYVIAFWTIPFGRTNFNIHLGRDNYATSSHFETSGIISAFWQSTIDASSAGTMSAHSISPTLYDSYYRRGSKHQRVRLTYATDGMPIIYADPPYNVNKYPVTDAQKKEGLDPLGAATAILAGVGSGSTSPCGRIAAVFDGRRRYNIEFTYLRDEPVKLPGLYNGTAHLCQLHYDQIAGFKPKILREGRALPPAYGWFAEFANAAVPNGHYVLPLKLWTATGFGTVTATLAQRKEQ